MDSNNILSFLLVKHVQLSRILIAILIILFIWFNVIAAIYNILEKLTLPQKPMDRRAVDNPNSKSSPTTAAKHFLLTHNHSSNDIHLSNTHWKILSNRDSVRKAREAHLILKANILEPYGLNIKEDV